MEKYRVKGRDENGNCVDVDMYLDRETDLINLEIVGGGFDLWPAKFQPALRQRLIDVGAVC